MNTNKEVIMNLEQKVICFLQDHASSHYSREHIAPLVAKQSLLENHLYQDLGFANRMEMHQFMSMHFPLLIKPKDVLWKKFIYDSIGEVAPACENCNDNVHCFACQN
ncbi:MAG: nitrogen fixation protein NifQ [Sulfurovaceae bacterium]|nr:nitrogen fixation protein NifQ [Sulfurovaceae bacterium]